MKSPNKKNIREEISDETILDVYKSVFKKKGISIKKFVIEHDKEEEVDYFHIVAPLGINFWVKWPAYTNSAYFISVVNEKESELKKISNANANTLVDAIALEYKKIIKKQNILKQILSLILEDVDDSTRNPLL